MQLLLWKIFCFSKLSSRKQQRSLLFPERDSSSPLCLLTWWPPQVQRCIIYLPALNWTSLGFVKKKDSAPTSAASGIPASGICVCSVIFFPTLPVSRIQRTFHQKLSKTFVWWHLVLLYHMYRFILFWVMRTLFIRNSPWRFEYLLVWKNYTSQGAPHISFSEVKGH